MTNDEKKEAAAFLLSIGATQQEAAGILGLSSKTVYRWVGETPEARERRRQYAAGKRKARKIDDTTTPGQPG
ncbi:helix-turn-helix domain-containing protein [Botrimarina mediterranea]|nr:helix-turn-helix domain-containing protein [Botrimarina mediterranea]